MEIYAKGQLSFLILNCLLERDFYGLDIITEIKTRSNGNIDLKKPSVYSNLTRMEKQGLVSSYMQSSELGPNRRYYSITEKGRTVYQELKEEFERNHFNVFRDFNAEEKPSQNNETALQEEDETEQENSDFFDFSSLSESPAKQEESASQDQFAEQNIKEEPVEEVRQSEPSPITASQRDTELPEKEETNAKSDAVVLGEEDRLQAEQYNKRLYDISKDMTRYRKKRSFAEDQIAMTAPEDPLQVSDEKTKAKVEEFKNSLLENKAKYSSRLTDEQFAFRMNRDKQEEPRTEEKPDDGVLITERLSSNSIGRAKMIEPPRLKIEPISQREQKLPAPKRDINIDPSHKEIISRIYSKSRASEDEQSENYMLDYEDLSQYYKKQNLSFKSYSKEKSKISHNTNKLMLITTLFTFFGLAVFSAVLFAILYSTNNLNTSTTFLYIVLPLLYLIDVAVKAYNNAKYTSWEPAPMKSQWLVWLGGLVICGVIVGLNFAFGMNSENFSLYATTLILPIGVTLILLPLRYYIKRYILIKYWK